MPLDLSLSQSKPAATELERRKRSQPLNGLRVLCIDNEPRILAGMATLISGWGCIVAEADSISAADEIAATHAVSPEIIIADYHLGDGNGIDAILRLRRQYQSHIPALLITADRMPEVRAEAERHDIGMQHKPAKPAAMRAYLTQVASLKRVAAE
jgi:CheY-like chemotaxis protein